MGNATSLEKMTVRKYITDYIWIFHELRTPWLNVWVNKGPYISYIFQRKQCIICFHSPIQMHKTIPFSNNNKKYQIPAKCISTLCVGFLHIVCSANRNYSFYTQIYSQKYHLQILISARVSDQPNVFAIYYTYKMSTTRTTIYISRSSYMPSTYIYNKIAHRSFSIFSSRAFPFCYIASKQHSNIFI